MPCQAWSSMGRACTEGGFRLCASDASILSSLLFLLAQLDLGCKWHAAVADMQRYQVYPWHHRSNPRLVVDIVDSLYTASSR